MGMSEKLNIWIACDKSGHRWLFEKKPVRGFREFNISQADRGYYFYLGDQFYKVLPEVEQVTWENSPMKMVVSFEKEVAE